jgi:drug/metabolite transporter (DMT)-like permease
MHEHTRGRLAVLGAAALFSTGGAAIKATSLTSWQVASYRSGIAALAVLLLLPAARRGWNARLVPVSIVYAVTMVLFVAANKLTTSANAIFLQSAAPLYILLLGPWLLHEKPKRSDLVVMIVVLTGLVFFFLGEDRASATAPDPRRGNLMAVASGVAWALTGLRWLGRGGKGGGSLAVVVSGNALAFAMCLPAALAASRAGPADWAILAFLGVFQIGLAYVLLTDGVQHLSALEASMLLLLEPALNPVWSWLLHGETPTAWAMAGGALIIAATAGQARYAAWQRRQAMTE